MDPTLDPTSIERLADALRSGDIPSIVGSALIVLAMAIGYVLQGKLPAVATGAVSIARAAAAGIGIGLLSTAAAGGDWWFGLTIGAAGLLASAGFLDLVRSVIPNRPGGGAGLTGLLLLVVALLALPGCGAAPCQAERAVVSALDVGVAVADDQLDAEPDAEEALRYSRGAVELGRAAVDACDLLRDGAGWESWVQLALEAASSLAAVFGGAGPADVAAPAEPPPELAEAIRMLEAEEAR